MKSNLPEYWKTLLVAYLGKVTGDTRTTLNATDFKTQVQIRFPDRSFIHFHHAFYLLDRERNEVAVFTEHCGYHVFPAAAIELEVLKSERTEIV